MALPGGGAFRAETWTLYAVGMLVIGLRLYVPKSSTQIIPQGRDTEC